MRHEDFCPGHEQIFKVAAGAGIYYSAIFIDKYLLSPYKTTTEFQRWSVVCGVVAVLVFGCYGRCFYLFHNITRFMAATNCKRKN